MLGCLAVPYFCLLDVYVGVASMGNGVAIHLCVTRTCVWGHVTRHLPMVGISDCTTVLKGW